MDYLELRKRKVYNKYLDSDIFNTRADSNLNKSYHPPKYKTSQPSLDKTKSDIFNTKEKNPDPFKARILKKRNIHLKNYKSDIFHTKSDVKGNKSCQRINVNHSTCFDGIKNNEEYSKDLNKYTMIHRPKQKKYDIEKYINKESAISRYYKELYGDEKSGVFPDKIRAYKTIKNSPEKKTINTTFNNNMKKFENRKKLLKRELTEINDVGVDGKKKPGEHLGQEKNNKGDRIIYNKRKIDIYGQNNDNKNNKKLIKEKNGYTYNPKLNKQLDYQSNIFNEKNKDINTNMDTFVQNKINEKENQKILKEKVKKEREEMNKKINEQKKKNVNKENTKLHPSNMKWNDLGARQLLFKRTYTMGDLNNNQEEITAFERKMQDLSNSNNIDILSKNKKSINLKNLKKVNNLNNDDNNVEKLKEILNDLPENGLREDQKLGVINKSTTSNFLNNKTEEKYKKIFNNINNNIKSARKSRSKKKKDSIIKIMGKNSGINKSNKDMNKKDYNVHNYTLVYSTKHNKFDKFENDDIKKIFGTKGVHVFDVKKNELGIGDLNTVEFKVRENDDNNEKKLDEKIKLVEDNFNNNKYKVTINKDKKKKITKDNRNPEEKEIKEIKENGKYIKTPYKPKAQKSFTSQFPKANLNYKNFQKYL